jgi:hypothetical protein
MVKKVLKRKISNEKETDQNASSIYDIIGESLF